MEHPCQQCGTTVEDGRPFCPQCRAPQIHVQVAAPDAEIAAGLNPALDELSQEIPVETRLASSQTRQVSSGSTMDRKIAVRAALQAGVLGVFIGMIPFLGIVLTGALAVFFYRRENGFALPAALGSRLGGAAGVVVFAINALLITIRIFVFHAQQEYTDYILKIAQRFGANAADPEIQASIHNLFTPTGLAITLFFGMIFTVVLASVGGALASLFSRPRNTRV
ncbi:MAG: zinc ribbon domain-containing protein [Terriglobales bacterium]